MPKSPFTDAIAQFSDLSEGDLHLSTYATVLLVLVILKDLPELSALLKESPNDRILDLIAKILAFASDYIKIFWKIKDDDERLKKQKEKINDLLKEIDLFAEVPVEIASASEELDGQLEKSEGIKVFLAEKMRAANGLLTQYRTGLAALRDQHIEALIAKIEQKIPLSQTEKESLKNPKQTQREILIGTLQALASQLEKPLTKESLHDLSEKQLVELLQKTLRSVTLTGIEVRVIHMLITNFAGANMRPPTTNELRTTLKGLDGIFAQEQKEEKALRESFERKVTEVGDGVKKTAQETTGLYGLTEERLAMLEKQVATPETPAEELVN